ncbi:MAG: response regulator transcription factor [Verrucomicrobiota bacterium]|jgi:DNA-binding NarL/FixJ family response regulator
MKKTAMAELRQKDRTRVLLVDDHPLVRQALRETLSLEGDLAVCGEAEDRQGTLAAIEASRPDLAIVDLGLKNSDGIALIKDIHDLHPQMFTLVLSMHDESLYAERAIRAGASGYISKQEAAAKIIEAVRKILAGEIYWSEKVAAQVASKVARSVRGADSPPSDLLSERELQVFELIGSGASTSGIAAMLRIDVSTVETYRTRIKEKMDLRDAGKLLQAAIRWTVAKGACCQLSSGKLG